MHTAELKPLLTPVAVFVFHLGKFGFWRFDKRTYVKPPPRHLGDPPEQMHNDMVRALISHINEATDNIPCWDEYYKNLKIVECGEQVPNPIYPTAKKQQLQRA